MHETYDEIINGIIIQAVKDYRKSLKKLKKHPGNKDALIMKDEVERFFRSEWYMQLTNLDGDFIISKIKAEVK